MVLALGVAVAVWLPVQWLQAESVDIFLGSLFMSSASFLFSLHPIASSAVTARTDIHLVMRSSLGVLVVRARAPRGGCAASA